MINIAGLAGFFVGLALIATLAFWAGRKGWWWLVALVSVPALAGGMMAMTMDRSGMSFFFSIFEWLAALQLIVSLAAYLVGRRRSANAAVEPKDFL